MSILQTFSDSFSFVVNVLTNAFSFDASTIIAVKDSNAPYSAGTTISIIGYGFAMYNPSPSCRIAQSPSSATIWSAGSFIVCKVGRVLSLFSIFSNAVIVSQFKFTSSLRNAFSFDVVNNFNMATVSSSPTTGGSLLLLAASNFGIVQRSSRLRFAASGCRSSVRIRKLDVLQAARSVTFCADLDFRFWVVLSCSVWSWNFRANHRECLWKLLAFYDTCEQCFNY